MALIDLQKSADELWAEIKDVDPRQLKGPARAEYLAKRLRLRELELRASHPTLQPKAREE